MHIAIIPGNGCAEAAKANWYGWAQKRLNEVPGVDCDLKVGSWVEAAKANWYVWAQKRLNKVPEVDCD